MWVLGWGIGNYTTSSLVIDPVIKNQIPSYYLENRSSQIVLKKTKYLLKTARSLLVLSSNQMILWSFSNTQNQKVFGSGFFKYQNQRVLKKSDTHLTLVLHVASFLWVHILNTSSQCSLYLSFPWELLPEHWILMHSYWFLTIIATKG